MSYYKKVRKSYPTRNRRIIVDNVLYELAKALKKIYLFADVDFPDLSLKNRIKKL